MQHGSLFLTSTCSDRMHILVAFASMLFEPSDTMQHSNKQLQCTSVLCANVNITGSMARGCSKTPTFRTAVLLLDVSMETGVGQCFDEAVCCSVALCAT